MASPTGHVHHSTPPPVTVAAPGTAGGVDPRWNSWSIAWTRQITVLTGRTDITVTVAPGAGHGAPACYIPSLASVEVDADLIGDPTITNPLRAGHKKDVPGPYGALVHEAAHAVHSLWTDPPGTPPVVSHIAAMLEESRAELGHRRRRPRDRQWIRACVNTVVDPSAAPTDTLFNAAYAAGLLLARVDTRILKPVDVRPLRKAVTKALGRPLLRRLRAIWLQAHTVADDDATAMISLARRWCSAVGVDPDTTPEIPDPSAGSGHAVAAAITAVLGRIAGITAPPPGFPGSGEHDDDDDGDPGPAPDPDLTPPTAPPPLPPASLGHGHAATWTTRAPRPAEVQAARRLGNALSRARTREPIMVREDTAAPPGRLRTRAAMAAAAQRAAGAVPTALPWQRTTRRPAPAPNLKVAVLVDVSGSMRAFAAPLSSAAWILGHAAHKAGAETTTIAVGARATVVIPPGRRPDGVPKLKANAGTECFDVAAALADRLLDLRTPGAARLMVVVSDGLFYDNGFDNAQRTLDRFIAAGCSVLWLAPAGQSTHTYTGATTVEVDDPADAIALIGKAAAKALTRI
jgi:Mg-chelatase subunit ChlD